VGRVNDRPVRDRFTVRPATSADLGMLADNLVDGFSSYRRWAPVTWSAPERLEMLTALLQRFSRDGSWCVAGWEGREPVGHATARPERDAEEHDVEGVARLTHLFVREPYWGSGIAGLLHDAIVDGMAQRGFTAAVLWTPEGQARARAFYLRSGWQETGARDPVNELGLELLEYRLDLPAS